MDNTFKIINILGYLFAAYLLYSIIGNIVWGIHEGLDTHLEPTIDPNFEPFPRPFSRPFPEPFPEPNDSPNDSPNESPNESPNIKPKNPTIVIDLPKHLGNTSNSICIRNEGKIVCGNKVAKKVSDNTPYDLIY